MFVQGFPKELKKEALLVSNKMLENTWHRSGLIISTDTSIWQITKEESVCFPYRIYLSDSIDDLNASFSPVQKLIYHCIFTRSNNGYIRENHTEALLKCETPYWAVPYILKVCDEYVVEILELVYSQLSKNDTSMYKNFCKLNIRKFLHSHNRMISYWNEFYRYKYPKYNDYIGKALFEKCFGYSRCMEKCIR